MSRENRLPWTRPDRQVQPMRWLEARRFLPTKSSRLLLRSRDITKYDYISWLDLRFCSLNLTIFWSEKDPKNVPSKSQFCGVAVFPFIPLKLPIFLPFPHVPTGHKFGNFRPCNFHLAVVAFRARNRTKWSFQVNTISPRRFPNCGV